MWQGRPQQSDRKMAVVMGRTQVMNGKIMEIGRTHEVSGKKDGMAGKMTAVVMGRSDVMMAWHRLLQ